MRIALRNLPFSYSICCPVHLITSRGIVRVHNLRERTMLSRLIEKAYGEMRTKQRNEGDRRKDPYFGGRQMAMKALRQKRRAREF